MTAQRTLLSLALLVLAARARADDLATAREHYLKANRAFALGAYDEAITEYSAAYRIKDDPALLYNIGQAHRLAGHAADALRSYKMYLTLAPQAPNRAEAENKIAELAKLIEHEKQAQQQLPPDTVRTPSEPRVSGSATSRVAEPNTQAVPQPPAPPADQLSTPRSGARTKLIAGVVVAGAGLATLVTGIALSAIAKQDSDALSNPSNPYDPAKARTGDTFGKAGPALLGVGGALLAAGVVVGVLGLRERHISETATARVLPMLAPGIAGAFAEVRF